MKENTGLANWNMDVQSVLRTRELVTTNDDCPVCGESLQGSSSKILRWPNGVGTHRKCVSYDKWIGALAKMNHLRATMLAAGNHGLDAFMNEANCVATLVSYWYQGLGEGGCSEREAEKVIEEETRSFENEMHKWRSDPVMADIDQKLREWGELDDITPTWGK